MANIASYIGEVKRDYYISLHMLPSREKYENDVNSYHEAEYIIKSYSAWVYAEANTKGNTSYSNIQWNDIYEKVVNMTIEDIERLFIEFNATKNNGNIRYYRRAVNDGSRTKTIF